MTTFGSLVLGSGQSPWFMVMVAVSASLIGMGTSWMKKQYKDDIGVGFVQYFFVKNIKGTILAVTAMLGGLFAAFAPLDYTTITLYQVTVQAFTIGYAANSVVNSAEEEK